MEGCTSDGTMPEDLHSRACGYTNSFARRASSFAATSNYGNSLAISSGWKCQRFYGYIHILAFPYCQAGVKCTPNSSVCSCNLYMNCSTVLYEVCEVQSGQLVVEYCWPDYPANSQKGFRLWSRFNCNTPAWLHLFRLKCQPLDGPICILLRISSTPICLCCRTPVSRHFDPASCLARVKSKSSHHWAL